MNDDAFQASSDGLRSRMRALFTYEPIPYCQQNAGDYVIPSMELREEVAAPTLTGFAAHLRS